MWSRASARRLSRLHHVGRLARLPGRQDPAPLSRGAGGRLDAIQDEGRGRPRRRHPAGHDRPRGDRPGHDARGRREPALGRRRGHRVDGRARPVRSVLDRGADEPGRHPRPRGDRPRRRPDPGRDRRARPQPDDVQAVPPGRGDLGLPDRRLPARRRQRGDRRAAARRRSSAFPSVRTPAASGCASWSSTCRSSTTSASAARSRAG